MPLQFGNYADRVIDLYIGGDLSKHADWSEFIDYVCNLDFKHHSLIRLHFEKITRLDRTTVGRLVYLREFVMDACSEMCLVGIPEQLFIRLLMSHEVTNFEYAERKFMIKPDEKATLGQKLSVWMYDLSAPFRGKFAPRSITTK